MKRLKEEWKRPLAMLLALVMLLSTINGAWAVSASAAESSISDAELVGNNYGEITNEERAILVSGLLKAQDHVYAVPSESDGLVTIDPEAKTITAQSYPTGSLVWEPKSASVEYAGGSEPVELTDGVGSFTYEGKAYSVKVSYALRIAVDAAVQRDLIEAPANLAQGVKNLNTLSGVNVRSDLETVGSNIDLLYSLMVEGVTNSAGMTIKFGSPEEKAAVTRLRDEYNANGKSFRLLSLMKEYAKSDTVQTQYLMTDGKGNSAKTYGVSTYTDLNTIWTGKVLENIATVLEFADRASDAAKVRKAQEALGRMCGAMKPAAEDPWTVLDKNPLKDNMAQADYVRLDPLVTAAIGNSSAHEDMTVNESLLAQTATVSCQVARCVVTVVVHGYVTDPNETDPTALTALEPRSITLELDEGMEMSEVLALIQANGVEDLALRAWNAESALYEIGETYYDRTATAVSGTLTEDMTYEITYTPKYYSVTYSFSTELPTSAPYGYCLTLPSHSDEEKVFDYVINGLNYFQGDVYRVTGDTEITQTEGKPWDANKLTRLITEVYGGDITTQEAQVLNASALKSEVVRLRKPGEEDSLLSIEGLGNNRYLIMAGDYVSGYKDLKWRPSAAVIIKRTRSEAETVEFPENSNSLTITAADLSSVRVIYKLDLDILQEDIQQVLDLPAQLYAEAAEQKANVGFLMNYYSQLGSIKRNLLNAGMGLVDTWTDEAKVAMQTLMQECMDDDGIFHIYNYLTEYKADGLVYYYQGGCRQMRYQVELLKLYLTDIVNDPAFEELKGEVDSIQEGASEKLEKLPQLMATLETIELTDPNEAIDITDPYLANLVEAIEACEDHTSGASANKDLTLTTPLTIAAPDQVAVKFTVQVVDGNGRVDRTDSNTMILPINTALTDADITAMNSMIAALEDGLNVDCAHYTSTSDFDLTVGTELSVSKQYTVTWEPAPYTVTFVAGGTPIGTVSFRFDNPTITLPACTEAGKEYVYVIGTDQIPVSNTSRTHRFTTAQIDGLFTEGNYTVVRETVDVARQNMVNLLRELNNAIWNGGLVDGSGSLIASFILHEDANGKYSIILRVSPQSITISDTLVMDIANAIVRGGFNEISVGGESMWKDGTVSLQAVVNAVLKSGFSLSKLHDSAILANGDLNELVLDSNSRSGGKLTVTHDKIKEPELLGAELARSSLSFDNGLISADLYVTMEDFDLRTSQLKSLRDMLGRVVAHGDIALDGGKIDVNVHDLPSKVYELYLSAMLLTGHADLAELSAMDHKVCMDYVADLLAPFVQDPEKAVSLDTFENTIAKVGKTVDLSKYKKIYDFVYGIACSIIQNSTFSEQTMAGKTYSVKMTYGISKLLEDNNISASLANLIQEKESGIVIPMSFTYDLEPADYEAVIVDISAAGLDKLKFSKDLATDITGVHSRTAVVLLSDVDGNVAFPGSGILDLNGKTINGNLSCGGTVMVVDSTQSNAEAGTITGTVTGNAKITAGHYQTDVSALLADTYVLDGDMVRNPYFTVSKQGSDITVNLTVDVNNAREINRAALVALAAELGADLALNYFVCESLEFNGHEIYQVEIQNVLDLIGGGLNADKINDVLDSINCAGITAFANEMLEKLTDFGAMATAIETGNALIEIPVRANAWEVELNTVGTGSEQYLDVSIVPGDEIKNQKIKVMLVSENNEDAVALLKDLSEIATVDAEVSLSDISYANQTVTMSGSGSADVTLNLKNDPSYAVIFAVIVADRSGSAQAKAALTAGIKEYCETKNIATLKQAVEGVTTGELILALRGMSMSRSFADMVNSLGLTGVVPAEVGELERVYHGVLTGAGATLRKMNIVGGSRTLGTFAVSGEYGVYSMDKTISRNGSRAVYGPYAVGYDVSELSAKLTVILFAESRIQVTSASGEILFLGDDLSAAFGKATDGSTVEILEDVEMQSDVTLSNDVTLLGASKINFNGYKLNLTEDAVLTADTQLDSYVASGVEGYRVKKSVEDGKYIYKLEKYPVVVMDASGVLKYSGDSLDEALASVEAGCTVTVNSAVTLRNNADIPCAITIEGASNVTWTGKLNLSVKDASVTADSDLADVVITNVEDYKVSARVEGETYTYTLEEIIYHVVVTDSTGARVYKGESLDEALAKAENGSTVTVNSAVKLVNDTTINKSITIEGAGKINWNGKKLTLGKTDVTLTADAKLTNVVSGVEDYKVDESGSYIYKLVAIVYDVVVTGSNGAVLYKGGDLDAALAAATANSTVTVNSAVTLKNDTTLNNSITVKGAGKINWNGKKLTLGKTDVTLTADAKLTNVVSGVEDYKVDESGSYIYKLVAIVYDVVVTGSNGAVLYKGGDLDAALAAATANSTVTVNSNVTLAKDTTVNNSITIKGASKINWNNKKLTLGKTDVTLTTDAKLTNVVSGVEDYKVDESGSYTYKLVAIVYDVVVTGSNGAVLYKGSDLDAALAAATANSTVTVNSAVTLKNDTTLNNSITIKGASKINWNGKKLTLGKTDVTLTTDAKLTNVVSGVEDYKVDESGSYIYKLVAIVYDVVVTGSNGAVLYKGSDLDEALAKAENGSTVTVNSAVKLVNDTTINKSITIKGAGKINWNGKKLTLGKTDVTLTADAKLTNMVSGDPSYKVSETGAYVYTLVHYAVTVTSGSIVTGYDDLDAALAAATANSTVTVNSNVALAKDTTINNSITIKGASKINWNGKKLTLGKTGVTLTADAKLSNVVSGVEDYKVDESGSYTYKLVAIVYDVVVTGSNGAVLYKGGSLDEALAKVENGSTVTVNSNVTLANNANVSKSITITGAAKIAQGGNSLILQTSAVVTADAELTVKSADAAYAIEKTKSGTNYIYKAVLIPVPKITGAPTVKVKDSVYGARVDAGQKLIFLDVARNGVTLAEVEGLIQFPVKDADQVKLSVNGTVLYKERNLIVNGAKLTAVASNSKTSKTDTVTYTVIIMGDTNCNGRTDVNDAVLMSLHYQKITQLTGYAYMAADVNQNEKVDPNDAVKNEVKVQYGLSQYTSKLK